MPKLDLNITCAVILSFCALISPSITAIINNRHLYRIRQLELKHEAKKQQYELLYLKKLDIYQNFITEASSCNWMENDSDYIRISRLLHQASLLCDPASRPALKQLQAYINGRSFSYVKFNELLADITEAFNQELLSLLA